MTERKAAKLARQIAEKVKEKTDDDNEMMLVLAIAASLLMGKQVELRAKKRITFY